MNSLKRYLGIIWMLLGPAAIVFLVWQATQKLSQPQATTNEWLQWSIIIFVFTPVAAGMVIFGWYALKGEYEHEGN